jgi:hypothetical protein
MRRPQSSLLQNSFFRDGGIDPPVGGPPPGVEFGVGIVLNPDIYSCEQTGRDPRHRLKTFFNNFFEFD